MVSITCRREWILIVDRGEKNCRKKNGGLILWWEAIKRKRDRWISNLLMAEYGGIWLKIHRLWPCHCSQHPAYKPQGYDLSPWWLILLTIQSLNGYRQSPQEVPGRRVGGIFRELDTKKNIKKNKSCHGYRGLILLMWELRGCQKTENSFVFKSDTYILNAVVNACKICFIKRVTGFDIIDVFFLLYYICYCVVLSQCLSLILLDLSVKMYLQRYIGLQEDILSHIFSYFF